MPVDIQPKNRICKFSTTIMPHEIRKQNWNDYVSQRFLNTFVPKYGLICQINEVKHENLGNVLQNCSIKINFTCQCKVIQPEPDDIIKFNITNIVENSYYVYYDDIMTIGIPTSIIKMHVGEEVSCKIKSCTFLDNRFIILATLL